MKNEIINSIISNLRHGYKSLSHLKWVSSSSGFHVPVAGALGVAGLILALIKDHNFDNLTRLSWFSNRETHLQKLYLVPGLQNLGNNCFLNVILQALASCSYFQAYLQKVIGECDSSDTVGYSESLQLTFALAALLEELSAFGKGKVVLSPRKVMLAMTEYIQNFSLRSQQDAEEAFLHLLSSLREEFSDSYPADQSSLADSFDSSNCRILTPKRREILNEKERWQQHFLGPFDGILSSILACQSCSSQISLNFQFFHSLPLLPVLESVATIMTGCRLEDCLKQFISAEQVENYNCSQCWHIAAIKYLMLEGVKETEIEKLRRCSMQDSCTCHRLPHLEGLPWSNNFSRTLKQLSIARCPKILCIHLQRASINQFGELVKLQGHVSFPLILDILPFTLEKVLAADESQCNEHIKTFVGESILPQTKGCSNTMCTDMSSQANDKVGIPSSVVPSQPLVYRLVSVVEHFGKTGGGHYTVYRSVISKSPKECTDETLNPSIPQWFCISDSDVQSVSEEDVLAAEASILFYERIV
ncbi:ubiquitin carboxyl-terminal hydrolase 27 isoform X2 [Ricinus communis]|uniref:ubiquitin carboxyl-terminal hydrolase 27 isoform X2 n=1 Tax=Ricinus communis TaxID=3988 RepID=UPI0007722788|nr:ubiquitin carboxyl-terminal hydrolase 27 isoform X2 [Ricinus communis]|eukprot:XP_015583094.1 ubiquitin carboxyl-terminal hydrolase 27 isoform X2 [Ricinus communis]